MGLYVLLITCTCSQGRFFSHRRYSFLSSWIFFSLTELTDLTEPFCAPFEPTERLRHTDITERYCQWRYQWGGKSSLHPTHRGISVITPLPSGEGSGEGPLSFWPLCVLFICVLLWEKERTLHVRKNVWDSLGSFFLTEPTDLTEPICAQFRVHRRPSAYRYHRALLPKKGGGWWLLGVDD